MVSLKFASSHHLSRNYLKNIRDSWIIMSTYKRWFVVLVNGEFFFYIFSSSCFLLVFKCIWMYSYVSSCIQGSNCIRMYLVVSRDLIVFTCIQMYSMYPDVFICVRLYSGPKLYWHASGCIQGSNVFRCIRMYSMYPIVFRAQIVLVCIWLFPGVKLYSDVSECIQM